MHLWPYAGWWMFWVVIILIVAYVAFRASGAGRAQGPGSETAEEILKKRYARGEIDKAEYEQRLEDLRR